MIRVQIIFYIIDIQKIKITRMHFKRMHSFHINENKHELT